MITAKAAIFDLDCTLVDTLRRFFELFNEMLVARRKKPLSRDKFFEIYVADTLDDLIAKPPDKERERKLHEFWLEFLRKYRDGNPGSKLIPGVREVFQKLHDAEVPIAVITSCIAPPVQIKEELESFGLDKFVRVIVTGEDAIKDLNEYHFSKVEIFRLAVERLGVDPKDCVVVGDYWNDIRDSKKLGAKTVAVMTGLMRRELLEKYGPDAIIDSVRDLPKVVKFESKKL